MFRRDEASATMMRSSSAELKFHNKEVKPKSGLPTSRLGSTEALQSRPVCQTARRKAGRRSLDISELAVIKASLPKSKVSLHKTPSKPDCSTPALKSAVQALTVKYFQELRGIRLANKSSVNTVISFLSLLSSIDSTVSVSPSFHILESQAQISLQSYCSQPGQVVNALRKFTSCIGSISAETIKRAKEKLQRVKESLVMPHLVALLGFCKAAVAFWDSLHSVPLEPEQLRSTGHTRKSTHNFESSFADVSFIKPEEVSMQDVSLYSIMRDQSALQYQETLRDDTILSLQDLFRAFLKEKLTCLKLTSRLIPIKAQALTKAVGSKSNWCKEFLEMHECDPLETAQMFSDNRFKAEVLKVAALLV